MKLHRRDALKTLVLFGWALIFPPIAAAHDCGERTQDAPGDVIDQNWQAPNTNWEPTPWMPAELAARYRLYDAWFASKCAYPDGTGCCGTRDWGDVITGADPNIQSLGVKDTADANGNNGDVYWSVRYFCSSESERSAAKLMTLFSKIMNASNAGTTVLQAMKNWGLAIPPNYPSGSGMPWNVPSSIPGAVLSMITPTLGRNRAN